MNDVLNAIVGFLMGLFGILLGAAYFLPIIAVVVGIAVYFYLRQRRGRPTVFSAEEPGREGERKR